MRPKKVVFEKRLIYKRVFHNGVESLITHQGLWAIIANVCLENGIYFEYCDQRLIFPEPKWHLMDGFRCSQKELLTEFLSHNKSGLLEAPTRYGKTVLLINVLKVYAGLTTVLTMPGTSLLDQAVKELKEALPQRNIVKFGGGSRAKIPSEDITICTFDSLHRCDPGRVRLLLIDEPHECVTDSIIPEIMKFRHARRLGFTATTSGRFDGRDILIQGLIGPVLARRTYREAVDEGAICEIVVILLNFRINPESLRGVTTHDAVYRHVVHENVCIAGTTAEVINTIPANWQTLIFIENEKQARLLQAMVGENVPIAMAKLLTLKEREAFDESMRQGHITRCIASDIYSTGLTFHDLRVVVNAAGGGGSIGCIQKPGRLAEVRPGKKNGVLIDIQYLDPLPEDCKTRYPKGQEPWRFLTKDSIARIEVYQKKGYKILQANSIPELTSLFQQHCV